MRNIKNAKKYLKHIIKEVFGKEGLRRLEVKDFGGGGFLKSNLFYFNGFYIRIFITNLEDIPKASILIYNYYFDHSYLKNKSVTSVSSILRKKSFDKWNYKWLKNEENIKFTDHFMSIPYYKEIQSDFYSFVEKVKDNLNYGETYYYGDGYGKDRIEYLFENEVIYVKQGNFKIKLEDLIHCSKRYLIDRLNYIRSLKLDDIECFELKKASLVE